MKKQIAATKSQSLDNMETQLNSMESCKYAHLKHPWTTFQKWGKIEIKVGWHARRQMKKARKPCIHQHVQRIISDHPTSKTQIMFAFLGDLPRQSWGATKMGTSSRVSWNELGWAPSWLHQVLLADKIV